HESLSTSDLPSFPTRRSSDLATSTRICNRHAAGSSHRANFPRHDASSEARANELRPLGSNFSPLRSVARTRLHDPVFTPDRLTRSEEHTSELQSRGHLVCRLL